MKIDNNINEPWKRRTILLFERAKFLSLAYDEVGKSLLTTTGLTILPIDQADIFNKQLHLLGDTFPAPESMFIMSPHDAETYIELTDARNEVAIDKFNSIMHFCQLLGAKRVDIENINVVDKSNNKRFDLIGSYSDFNNQTNISSIDFQKLKRKLTFKASFQGGDYDYLLAKSYLTEKSLTSDSFLSTLLEMRNPEKVGGNKLERISREFSLTESLKNSFDFISTINFPQGFIQAKYTKTIQEQMEIFLKIVLEFE